MRKEQFIEELTKRLTFLPQDECKEIILYYEDLIYGYLEDGLSEEAAILKLGSIEEIIAKLSGELHFEVKSENILPNKQKIGKQHHQIDLKGINDIIVQSKVSRIIVNGSEENSLEYFNSLFLKIAIFKENDTLLIKHNQKFFIFYSCLYGLCLILGAALALSLYFTILNSLWVILIGFAPLIIVNTLMRILNIIFKFNQLNINLIKNEHLNFKLQGSAGDIKINNMIFNNLEIYITSGNLIINDTYAENNFFKATSGNIKINNEILKKRSNKTELFVKSGNITINNFLCTTMNLKCSSGNYCLGSIDCLDALSLSVTSGNITAQSIIVNNLSAVVRSGNIMIAYLKAKQNSNIKVTSGNYKIKELDCPDTVFIVKSGMVNITAKGKREDYLMDLRSTSGVVKVMGEDKDNPFKEYLDTSKKMKGYVTSGCIFIKFI